MALPRTAVTAPLAMFSCSVLVILLGGVQGDSFASEEQTFETLGVRAKENFLKKMTVSEREDFWGRLDVNDREPDEQELKSYEDGKHPFYRELDREEKNWDAMPVHPTPSPTRPPTPKPKWPWPHHGPPIAAGPHGHARGPPIVSGPHAHYNPSTPHHNVATHHRAEMPGVKCGPKGCVVLNVYKKRSCSKGAWHVKDGRLYCGKKFRTPSPTPWSCPKLTRPHHCPVGQVVATTLVQELKIGTARKVGCKELKCMPSPCPKHPKRKTCIPFPRHNMLKWVHVPVKGAVTTVRCQDFVCVTPHTKKKAQTHSLLQFTAHKGHAVGPIWPAQCTPPQGVYSTGTAAALAAQGLTDTDKVKEADATTLEQCATMCLSVHTCNGFNWLGRHRFTEEESRTMHVCQLCTENDYTTSADGQEIDAYTRKKQVHEFVGDDDAAVDDDQKEGGREEQAGSRRRRGAIMASPLRAEEERKEADTRLQCAKHSITKGPCYAEVGNELKKISMRTLCMNDDDDDPTGVCASWCCKYCSEHVPQPRSANSAAGAAAQSGRSGLCTHWMLDQYGSCVLYEAADDGLTKANPNVKAQCFRGARVSDPALSYLHKAAEGVHAGTGKPNAGWKPGAGETGLQRSVDTDWQTNERGDCDGHPCGVKCPETVHGTCARSNWRKCMKCAISAGLADPETCSQPHIEFVCENLATATKAEASRTKLGGRPYVQPELVPFGGFRTSFGEMGACLLDKAELLVDMAYEMATCTRYEAWEGASCYVNQADVFMQQLRLCCVGRDKLAHQTSIKACNMAILPIMPLFLKRAKPLFDRCARDPTHVPCKQLNREIKSCFSLFTAWRKGPRPKKFRSETERSDHFDQWIKQNREKHETNEIQCRGLFLGPKQPGNHGPDFLSMFRHLVRGATSLFSFAGWSDKSGERYGKENPDVRDVTGRAMKLLRLCEPPTKTKHIDIASSAQDEPVDNEEDAAQALDGVCAMRLAALINPTDVDRGNAFDAAPP